MNETGIVRKVDKVGRIVLPREVRWKYKIECGDMVEIYTDQDCICLKKYETDTNVMEQVEVLYETVDKMEKELKETKELEEYLKRVRSKLDQLQKLKGV
ncbi:MAG: AbrB/MazE/SpoVT family DNA-binding domain-containing protein [Lachnospiraceae bacterium]